MDPPTCARSASATGPRNPASGTWPRRASVPLSGSNATCSRAHGTLASRSAMPSRTVPASERRRSFSVTNDWIAASDTGSKFSSPAPLQARPAVTASESGTPAGAPIAGGGLSGASRLAGRPAGTDGPDGDGAPIMAPCVAADAATSADTGFRRGAAICGGGVAGADRPTSVSAESFRPEGAGAVSATFLSVAAGVGSGVTVPLVSAVEAGGARMIVSSPTGSDVAI